MRVMEFVNFKHTQHAAIVMGAIGLAELL